jgi:hypothetical protein
MNGSKKIALLSIIIVFSFSFTCQTVSAQATPQRPSFTVEVNDHSYDSQPVYETNQFTGEKVLVSAAEHYEWRTLDFTIQNQQTTQGDLYYNFRYKGQYASNWTNVYYENRYVKAEAGPVSSIPFLISGQIPSGQGNFYHIPIPEGATVAFEVQALIGTTTRGSSMFASGDIFTGEASEWSDAVSVTFGTIASTNPTISTYPTANQQSTQTLNNYGLSFEQLAIVALSIVVVILVVTLLMRQRNVRKNPRDTL